MQRDEGSMRPELSTRRRTSCPRRAASRRRTMVSALFAATEFCKARRRSVIAMDGLLSWQDGCKNIGVLLGQLIYHISTERAKTSVVLRSSSLWLAGTARYDGRGCKISRIVKLGACEPRRESATRKLHSGMKVLFFERGIFAAARKDFGPIGRTWFGG